MKIWAIARTVLLVIGIYYALKFLIRLFKARQGSSNSNSTHRGHSEPRKQKGTIELKAKGSQKDKDGNEIIEYGE
jgi:hypothetical protein